MTDAESRPAADGTPTVCGDEGPGGGPSVARRVANRLPDHAGRAINPASNRQQGRVARSGFPHGPAGQRGTAGESGGCGKGGNSLMVDFDKDGLGDVGSDEAAVAAVVQAFQTGAANAGKLRSCLIQRLFEGHLPRLTAIARTRLREQAKTDDPDNVASDVITKFCEKLASRTGEPVENVAAFLTAMTKHACDDCPGPPPLPPDGRRPAPIDPTEAESLLEAECHLYFSIIALEPTLREMLLINVGWHTGFNKRHGGPPRRRVTPRPWRSF